VSAFISKEAALDAGLSIVAVDGTSPDEHGITFERSENDLLTGADELPLFPVSVFARRIMAFKQFITISITVFCEPPKKLAHSSSTKAKGLYFHFHPRPFRVIESIRVFFNYLPVVRIYRFLQGIE
jgi:hypothetical protein